jgi:hypothetical protein
MRLVRAMGADVSDGFASTLPFVRESPDHAHFRCVRRSLGSVVQSADAPCRRDTPAMEWWMRETLHKLALCPT